MTEGISFMIRARNEEATLEESIRSLFSLTIPYEIVVILHLCTDSSLDIVKRLAEENSRIKWFEYNIEVSRAGYETLVTDISSQYSFISYCYWCKNKCTLPWLFKWDADFKTTPELIEFLNSKTWEKGHDTYIINAKSVDSDNYEPYLIGHIVEYCKNFFWEAPYYLFEHCINVPKNIYIEHCSTIKNFKGYWKKEPWFMNDTSAEAKIYRERYNKLVADFGHEPEGLAAAGNKIHESLIHKIYNAHPSYVNYTS